MSKTDLFIARQIIETVNKAYEIDLASKSRDRLLVYLRFICYHILRSRYPKMTLVDIGIVFKRDHATVIYGLTKYTELKDYEDFKEMEFETMKLLSFKVDTAKIYCNPITYPLYV
jgi:chromosomal replication initiation ATPase DnaA